MGSTPEETMHSISAGTTGPPVVMMPGYSAGSGFFFRNMAGLAGKSRVFLVDWLGTGELLHCLNVYTNDNPHLLKCSIFCIAVWTSQQHVGRVLFSRQAVCMHAGLSGRPPFDCKTREETEAWFVESLDKWREAQGLESMVLVGHSLGAYLSACYALAHPERVSHLVLVCPAGAQLHA